jgi:lipopolysaccharide biosynthesis protein
MIHGFYPDVLDDILLKLPSFCAGTVGTQLDLYVSTPMDQIDQVEKKLRDLDFACVRLFGVENRGRDMAPFLLHLLPAVAAADHHFFVKLHTKKSLQFGIDGLDKWSRHLIESLLSAAGLEAIRYQFLNAKDLGCLCPSGTLLPLAIALFKNKAHLHHLLSHSEINGHWRKNLWLAVCLLAVLRPSAHCSIKAFRWTTLNLKVASLMEHWPMLLNV